MPEITSVENNMMDRSRRGHFIEKDRDEKDCGCSDIRGKKYEKDCECSHNHSGKDKCQCNKSICKVIESIADEEMAIACILKAECEKIKKAVHLACNVKELVVVNESVGDTLKDIIKLQMLLQYKLEEANKSLK